MSCMRMYRRALSPFRLPAVGFLSVACNKMEARSALTPIGLPRRLAKKSVKSTNNCCGRNSKETPVCVCVCVCVCVYLPIYSSRVGRVFQSVWRLTTGWTARGSNPCGARFSPVQTVLGAHPASCTMGTGSFPGIKYGKVVLLTTHPLLVPWSWKSRAIPLPTIWATTGPVTGTLYLYLS